MTAVTGERVRAFTHPLWWAALLLLLLNDHVLKGSGLLPGALTGKLSDLAGMLVAPPLLVALLRARRPWGRMAAAALVGGGFALIKLTPQLAHAAEHGLGLLGLPSRIWIDPSDLWALLALPLGAWLSRPVPARAGSPWPARGAVALGAAACLATAGTHNGDSGRKDAPDLENDTGDALSLVLSSTEGAGGCSLYRDDRSALLTADAFSATREVTLDAGARVALPLDPETTPCGAASIALPDGEQHYVLWRGLDQIADFVGADDTQRKARRVVVNGKTGRFKLALGSDLKSFEPGGTAPDSTCAEDQPAYSLEATAFADAQGFLQLSEIRRDPDGCLESDWLTGEGDGGVDTARLCVPDWAFPFKTGERLAVTQELGADGDRSVRITRFDAAVAKLQLVIWNDAQSFGDGALQAVTPVDCVGTLSDCGSYLRPVAVRVRGKDALLRSGDETTLKADAPKTRRILIGAGRDVAWAGAQCQGRDARVGALVNALELRTY